MVSRFEKAHAILYITITIGYLIHWIHNDLEYFPGKFGLSFQNNVWQVIYIVGANFLFFEYALPFVAAGKSYRVISIVSSIIIYLVLFVMGLYLWRALGTMIDIYQPLKNYISAGQALSDSVRFAPGAFIVFAVFKLFFDYTRLKYQEQQVKLEKKQAELVFLKSQINPHFLFNTLNNIYSLSQYQPKLVSESVLRLSKLLRYLLYEANHEFITIEKEIKIVTDYIDLEKLRYSETVAIAFNHDVRDHSEVMPPLLLLPLVENAFKHGVSISRGKRFVDVTCTVKDRQMHFCVRNSIPNVTDRGGEPVSFPEPPGAEGGNRIGLANLRRRLSLLYKDFQFSTETKEGTFTADLKINLSSHV